MTHNLFLGMVLGSFYYGYIVLQIPGGWLATKIGGTRIFGMALFLASILTLLTPAAARYSVYALITLRVLEGVFLVSQYLVEQSGIYEPISVKACFHLTASITQKAYEFSCVHFDKIRDFAVKWKRAFSFDVVSKLIRNILIKGEKGHRNWNSTWIFPIFLLFRASYSRVIMLFGDNGLHPMRDLGYSLSPQQVRKLQLSKSNIDTKIK